MPTGIGEFPTGVGVAAIAFVACALIGWLVDRLLYSILSSRFAAAGWAPGKDLAAGLRGLATVAGILVGSRLAMGRLALHGEALETAKAAIQVVAILIATAFIARVAGRVVRAYARRESSHLPSTSIFVNLARGLVWVLGLVSLLASLGVSIAPLITALGVGGLAVGLALQPTLENVFSGIQVLASRQIEPGDHIRLETGEEGQVVDVTWRNTAIRTGSNDIIVVPNAVIGRSRITNFTTVSCEHVLSVPLFVYADADIEVVERVLREAAERVVAEVGGVVRDAKPIVRFGELTVHGLQVNVAVRLESYAQRPKVRHELIRHIQGSLAEANLLGALNTGRTTGVS